MILDTSGKDAAPEWDVLIVGGGMVGAALALALADVPWRVAVIEQQAPTETVLPAQAQDVNDFESRVSAITEASRRLLAALGAWPDHPRICAYRQMQVWDGDGSGQIAFDAADLHLPNLGHIVENRLIQGALLERLQATPRIHLMLGQRPVGLWRDAGKQGLTLDTGERLTARLIVGADGALSRVRQWTGLPTREWDYGHTAIVCTVKTERPHAHTAWQRFSPSGPLAFLPLSHGDAGEQYCSIVWSQLSTQAEALMGLDDATFCEALGNAFEHRLGRIIGVSRRQGIPLRQRHAKDYVSTGCALLGDAAHTIHPLAGQGVNLGFADVRVLSEELHRAAQRGLSPADASVLQRYQRRRKGENLAMMAAMEGFKQLFARDEPVLRWVRNAGMRWLDGQAALKRRVIAEAMGLHG